MLKQDLDHLHKVQLMIMDEVDRICRKYNINYFLDSGSALGAIRHGGFIPWDDDMDIGMCRLDYEKFLMVSKSELDKRFFLQTKETDPSFIKYCAKIRMNGTCILESNMNTSGHCGIFIDIFPFDKISADPNCAKRIIQKSRRRWRWLRFRQRAADMMPFRKRIFRYFLEVIPEKIFERAYLRTLEYQEKGQVALTCYSYKMFQTHDLWFQTQWMLPVHDIKFEDRVYQIMHDPNAYLRRMYGDYMTLPPEEKRGGHITGEIDYGEY